MKKEAKMDAARFRAVLEAYGAHPDRWPAGEREAVEAFAEKHPSAAAPLIADAKALDAALGSAHNEPAPGYELLAARVLRRRPAPEALDRRALMALAACAIFGVLIGYGGALLTPPGDLGFSLAEVFAEPYPGEDG
jgi:hypothetical protein